MSIKTGFQQLKTGLAKRNSINISTGNQCGSLLKHEEFV